MIATWVRGEQPAASAADLTPPNVLLIVTDDMRSEMTWMPKTERLIGNKGLTFDNAYVTTPVCCPSRSSIFSGKYIHNHGVVGNSQPELVQAYDQEETWPMRLRQEGYRTGLVGKFLNTWGRETPPMFDFYEKRRLRRASLDESRFRFGQEFIQENETQDSTPWALVWSMHAPHSPYEPSDKYAKYRVGPYPRNPATWEKDLSDKPAAVLASQQSESELQAIWRGQARSMLTADDLVHSMIRYLRETDELADTLIVFTSDNGWMLGEHGLSRKSWSYPGSTRVPMMMRWPGQLAPGTVSPDVVANIDIAPTILEATGIDAQYSIDGRSMLGSAPREWLLLEGPKKRREGAELHIWDAYVSKDVHYVKWESGEEELYDADDDPFQLDNLLYQPKRRRISEAANYSQAIDAAVQCQGASCP